MTQYESLQNTRTSCICSPHKPVRGTAEHSCVQQEVTGEEEPEEAPKAALGGLFGRAKRTAQVRPISRLKFPTDALI